jgi:hypothetical protein
MFPLIGHLFLGEEKNSWVKKTGFEQGCQMVCFQTKNPNLGKFWRENAGIFYCHLEYCTVIWYILWPFGKVVVIWYLFLRFGILCQEKSGNPGFESIFFLQQKKVV